MKKVLAVILSVSFLMGTFIIPARAEDVTAQVNGIRTGDSTIFAVAAENNNESEEEFNVYVAGYEKGILKSAKSYSEKLGAREKTVFRYDAPNETENTRIFVWSKGMKPFSPALTSAQCESLGEEIKIPYTASDAFASFVPEENNGAGNACDGDLNTVWTVSGSSEENSEDLTIYLGGYYILSKVKIAFGLASEREYIYSVSVSEDGENFTAVTKKLVSAKKDGLQEVLLPPVRAKYVRINVMGRSDGGNWVQLAEVESFGYEDTTGTVLMENVKNWNILPMSEMTYTNYKPMQGNELYAEEADGGIALFDNVGRDEAFGELKIASVEASQVPEEKNKPANTMDDDLATIWTASGVTDANSAYLDCDMGKGCYITGVSIGFDKGTERTYTFDVSLSEDGKNYKVVIPKRESGKTNEVQFFDFEQTYARFVKYTFYKRTDSGDNGWIRISEVDVFGTETPISGAGGILAQKSLVLPAERGDFELKFDLNLTGNVYYSGISLTNSFTTGGADLESVAALQLRFDNDGDKFKIKYIKSNYFNEGGLIDLFEKSFNKGQNAEVKMYVSPLERKAEITISQGDVSETRILYFSHGDDELTRNTRWNGWEANTLAVNTGAGAKGNVKIANLSLRDADEDGVKPAGSEPCYGVVRLEAVRREDYPTSSGDYYGRYVYYNGADAILSVAADKNPSVTRFVEHRGLIGCGVSFEAENMPGY